MYSPSLVPERVHAVFGMEHMTYFAVSNIVGIAALVLVLKFCRSDKSQNTALLVTAGLLLAAAVIHRFILAFHPGSAPYGGWQYLIPSSFCSVTATAFGTTVLLIRNKNHPVFHCLMYMAFIGPVIVKFYPDWLFRDGLSHPATVVALIHHSLSFYLCMAIVFMGKWRPNIRLWYAAYLGTAMYILLGHFLVQALDLYASMGIWFRISDYVYINGEFHHVTLTRGRHIVLDWLWWWPVTPIFVAYHWAVMGGWILAEKKGARILGFFRRRSDAVDVAYKRT